MSAKLRAADITIAIGTLILFVSTFLPWFGLPSASDLLQAAPGAQLVGGGEDQEIGLNVWDLGVARWWIYLSILLGACFVLAALLSRTPDWSTIIGSPLFVASLIATICLIVRLISPPSDSASTELGFYLALAGSAMLMAGTFWALRDDTVPDGFQKAPRPELIEVD